MTKNEYLDALCAHLGGLPPKEKQEILLDFQEHFASGLALGKTEEEICKDLGAPEFAAQQYVGETASTQPIPPIPPTAVPPVQQAYAAPYSPRPPQPAVSAIDKTIYVVVLILLIIFVALPGYPTAIAFFVAFLALFVSGIAAAVFTGSAGLFFLLLSIGGIFLSLGALLFIGITAALRACVRSMNKG